MSWKIFKFLLASSFNNIVTFTPANGSLSQDMNSIIKCINECQITVSVQLFRHWIKCARNFNLIFFSYTICTLCEIGNFLISKLGIWGGFPNWEGSVYPTWFKEIDGPVSIWIAIVSNNCMTKALISSLNWIS